MTSKLVALRLPEELVQAIESQATVVGRDKSTLVIEALQQVFGSTSSEPSIAVMVEGIQEQLHELQQGLNELQAQLNELQARVNKPLAS